MFLEILKKGLIVAIVRILIVGLREHFDRLSVTLQPSERSKDSFQL